MAYKYDPVLMINVPVKAQDKLVEVPDEKLRTFESALKSGGFSIVSKKKYGNPKCTHYQVESSEKANNREELKKLADKLDKICDIADKLAPTTWNIGAGNDGKVTAGIDVREAYVKDECPEGLTCDAGYSLAEYNDDKATLQEYAKRKRDAMAKGDKKTAEYWAKSYDYLQKTIQSEKTQVAKDIAKFFKSQGIDATVDNSRKNFVYVILPLPDEEYVKAKEFAKKKIGNLMELHEAMSGGFSRTAPKKMENLSRELSKVLGLDSAISTCDIDYSGINKPKKISLSDVKVKCPNCGYNFKVAKRCPECGQLIEYTGI